MKVGASQDPKSNKPILRRNAHSNLSLVVERLAPTYAQLDVRFPEDEQMRCTRNFTPALEAHQACESHGSYKNRSNASETSREIKKKLIPK